MSGYGPVEVQAERWRRPATGVLAVLAPFATGVGSGMFGPNGEFFGEGLALASGESFFGALTAPVNNQRRLLVYAVGNVCYIVGVAIGATIQRYPNEVSNLISTVMNYI